jgi:hypothetical protein
MRDTTAILTRVRLPWVFALATTACSGTSQPTAPTTGAPTPASSAPFVIELPIAAGDGATFAYGIWPYGVHGSSHALDGHPGFDIEYRVGAPVLAAADGVVHSVMPDGHDPGRRVVELRHPRDRGLYLTDYTNLTSVPDRLVPGTTVARGELIGIAGPFLDGRSAMIHFQVGDPTHLENGSIIASPAGFVSASARALLDDLWRATNYRAELCEPFLTNSRAHGFPIARTWTRQSGAGPAAIDVTCVSDSGDVAYVMRDADGSPSESGSVTIGWSARPMTADFAPPSGASRLAVYDIVSDTMRIAFGAPGSARPSLGAASTYTTR